MKQENETRYNLSITDGNGQTTTKENAVESVKEKLTAEAPTKGLTIEVTRAKTFVVTEAESLEEASQIFPQRALEFLNYGARLAQHNLKQDLMEDPDWSEAATDGAFDLLPHIQEPKERKKASPRDKAIAFFLKTAHESGNTAVTREQVEAILAQFMGAGNASPAQPTA